VKALFEKETKRCSYAFFFVVLLFDSVLQAKHVQKQGLPFYYFSDSTASVKKNGYKIKSMRILDLLSWALFQADNIVYESISFISSFE
jgi:hypothetical protein